jgi:radical SAM-linked protein
MSTAIKQRLRFAKRGELRLVSHHDLMRCLERMVRRARIPLAMSQGFTPRPKISFALALGLGIEGHDEVVDIELSQPVDPTELLRRLAEASPAGLQWLEARTLPGSAPAPRPVAVEYCLCVPQERRAAALAAVKSFLASKSCLVTRRRADRGSEHTYDLRASIADASMSEDGVLRAILIIRPEGSARPEELLECLGLRDLLDRGAVLVRTHVELDCDRNRIEPEKGRDHIAGSS